MNEERIDKERMNRRDKGRRGDKMYEERKDERERKK